MLLLGFFLIELTLFYQTLSKISTQDNNSMTTASFPKTSKQNQKKSNQNRKTHIRKIYSCLNANC